MNKLHNGWHLPDGDEKMTRMVFEDVSMFNPQYESKQRDTLIKWMGRKIHYNFVDVGGNVGVWSIPMSKHFDNVYSFEPSRRNREALEANTADIKNIHIKDVALSDHNDTQYFHDEIKNCGNSKLWESGGTGTYKVQCSKLDDMHIPKVGLIKIDVQGYEWQVIQGAQQLLETEQPWVAFEVSADVDQICKFLEDRGYDMIDNKSKRLFIYAPTTGRLAPKPEAFGRRMGPGPYITLLPKDKQEIAKERWG